jgi:hypothetical protein
MRPHLFAIPFAALALAAPSQAAGPTARGCVAANEAAVKLGEDKKLRAAREQLLLCASPSCPQEVRAECTHQVDEINLLLPTVIFSVKKTNGDDVAAVRVTMDGEVVADRLDGTELTLDPGSHVMTFEAEGEATVTRSFVLHEGEKRRRETILFGSIAMSPVRAKDDTPERGHTQRVLGVVTATTGGLGLGIGAIVGAFASSAWSNAKAACPRQAACSAQAVSDSRSAMTDATASTVLLVVGGVALGTGITLFLLAPKATAPSVGLTVGPGRLAVGGAF